MPITVEILDPQVTEDAFRMVFFYFTYIDDTFSTYKDASEISKINRGEIALENYSHDMQAVMALCEETQFATDGYFDIVNAKGDLDPSGLVKGWAIQKAAELLKAKGFREFYIDAGGDVQTMGKDWKVGIKNPFNEKEIVKALSIKDKGIATSGTYIRGQHIYNPKNRNEAITDVVSLTVIGPNVYEADRFATAAFAMGKRGIEFVEQLPGFEGYQIDSQGVATMTSNFPTYELH